MSSALRSSGMSWALDINKQRLVVTWITAENPGKLNTMTKPSVLTRCTADGPYQGLSMPGSLNAETDGVTIVHVALQIPCLPPKRK